MSFFQSEIARILFKLLLLSAFILKIAVFRKIDSFKQNKISNFDLPVFESINRSIDVQLENSSINNIFVIYGPYQSGKTYVLNRLLLNSENNSYIHLTTTKYCINDESNFFDVFMQLINETSNETQIQQNETNSSYPYGFPENETFTNLTESLKANDSKSVQTILEQMNQLHKFIIAIHNLNYSIVNSSTNFSTYSGIFSNCTNITFIIETSDYNFIVQKDPHVKIISTETIFNDTALLRSKQYPIFDSNEIQSIEKSFGNHFGSIMQIIEGVRKGSKLDDVVNNIQHQIFDTIHSIDPQYQNNSLVICNNTNTTFTQINSTQLNLIEPFLSKGFLYINKTNYIQFAHPTIKSILCDKFNPTYNQQTTLNQTEINQTEVNRTEINQTEVNRTEINQT